MATDKLLLQKYGKHYCESTTSNKENQKMIQTYNYDMLTNNFMYQEFNYLPCWTEGRLDFICIPDYTYDPQGEEG